LGRTDLPVALVDRVTLTAIRNLVTAPISSVERLSQLGVLRSISRFTTTAATIPAVKRQQDWRGFAWAVGTVALATAIGWPLVHSSLHLANVNVLMLYLLSVIWVATHYSRGAAVLASVLGVATFDFVFVEPYYTFAVADEQYLVTFGVMLLTALVISTLTDQMRKQSELARQAWERVETEFLRNTLLSGVSHDLRTPLAAITGASSAIIGSDGKLDAATHNDLLKTISVESARMERLINNLLDMTRLESGGLVLKRDWHPLQEVIGSALNHMDNRLRGREVRIEGSPDLPLVQMDAMAIEQVLSNLLDNAVEHTPTGTPIEIRADASGGELTVEVADHGLGLPPGTERRVFEKFFRVHPPGMRGGVGLGLAIARGIIEAHGGTISAANRAAGGAVFRFTIPLVPAPPVLDTSA
jgi:two-component system sensor histidine kinase KdpD